MMKNTDYSLRKKNVAVELESDNNPWVVSVNR